MAKRGRGQTGLPYRGGRTLTALAALRAVQSEGTATAFQLMQSAFLKMATDAAESERAARRPCPDYIASLCEAVAQIQCAESVPDLCAVPWIQAQAALGVELLTG